MLMKDAKKGPSEEIGRLAKAEGVDAGALSALMIYLMCRIMFPDWKWAFAATLVYLTTHEVLHWTRGVHLETVLNFWTLTGLLCAYLSVRHPAAILGIGVAAALGWLAKGPQSLYPGAVALIIWFIEGILWRRLFSGWSLVAGFILVAALAPWFTLRLQERSGFAEGYFVKELGRTIFGPTQTHNGPFYYFMILPATYWPWFPAAVFGFFILFRGRRRSLGARVWLAFAAVVAVIVLLTAEKRARYLFQLYPVFSVAGGAAVQHIAMPGEVTLGRLTRKNGRYWMAIAPAEFLAFPEKQAIAKSEATTGEWPHAFTKLKVPPERFIASYSSNHIHGVYGDYVEELKWVCKMLNMEAEVYV